MNQFDMPAWRPSPSTAAHAAAERREAARALLQSPVLTVERHPQELALVHRHVPALMQTFFRLLGYRLVVESGFARLSKTPLGPQEGPVRWVRTGKKGVLDSAAYPLFCLACAALLAPGTGEQILISGLVEQIRADAAAASVPIADDRAGHRRLAHVLGVLVAWGVIQETDGTVGAWRESSDEALLTINRPVLPHLLVRRLPPGAVDVSGLWSQEPAGEEPRRSLRRKLVENPLVRREDLSEAERDVLSRERADLTRQLEENFGLSVEVRLEGALAFDMDGDLSDVEFPGTGTVRQAALLLIDALLDIGRPSAGQQARVGGRTVAGLGCTWEALDTELSALVSRYKKAWAAEYVGDLGRLRSEVVGLLESVSLVETDDEGVVVRPAAARYRPEPRRMPRGIPGQCAGSPGSAADTLSEEEDL
ncbi:TIGR02678 family protein [Streptomyces sp. NPDC048257]|uniref:TIGR02678 family protein n=1 Tax=Streptomyces sp. NPDC048257 TaxID=3365526 RepID=UPI003717891C